MIDFALASSDGSMAGITTIGANSIHVDLLWLDSRAPEFLTFPNIGKVQIPEKYRNHWGSLLITDIELNYEVSSTV